MEIELTKSAKRSLAYIYHEYDHRISNGVPKIKARLFETGDQVYERFISVISDDIAELKKQGFIKVSILHEVELLDKGIIYMEELPEDLTKDLFLFVSKLFL